MSASTAKTPDHRTTPGWPLKKLRQMVLLARESHEVPIAGEPSEPVTVSSSETGITFIGHSSFLLQIGGKNVLVDPVFSTRLVVLRRQRHPGLRLTDLPPIDLVLITHAHMDHLNLTSLRKIVRNTRKLRGSAPEVVVPTGVDDLVQRIGFAHVHTMSWWDERSISGLRLTMTPCRHWGARMFKDTHREFGGYVLQPEQGGTVVYHSGDTAYFDGFREIAARLHPDIALLPIGAYFPDTYRSVHTSPEEAVRAFVEMGAQIMIPMHYGTFRLGREPMEEPLQRLATETVRLGLEHRVRVVAEGETLRISADAPAPAVQAVSQS
jgi:L-ascorbate metabolism protein UlaG (beta-lactamase superfamily)